MPNRKFKIKTDQLTPKQIRLLEYYVDYSHWRPPSYTAMMRHMNVKSKNAISKLLEQLKKKGYI